MAAGATGVMWKGNDGGAEEGALPLALEVGSMISTSSSVGWEKFRLNIAGKSGLTSFSVTK